MTHKEVKKSDAAAKYLQGGLSEKEREEFEEHLFHCPECAGIVKADAVLKACGELARGKEVPEEDDEEEGSGPVIGKALQWVALHPPLAAAALLVAALAVPWAGYLSLYKIPWLQEENERLEAANERLSSPRGVSFQILGGQARNGSDAGGPPGQIVRLAPGCTEVILEMEIDSAAPVDDYSEVRSFIEGKSGALEILHSDRGGIMLHALVPCSELPTGDYELKVYGLRGGTQTLIGMYRFGAQRE